MLVGLPIFLLSLVIVFSFTPRYTAQSLGLVDTSSKNLLDPDAATTSGLTDNSRVEGEVRIIQSDAVLLEAIREGKLLSDPEFALVSATDYSPPLGSLPTRPQAMRAG